MKGARVRREKMKEELKKEREGEYGGNWRGRDGKKRRLRVGREKI